MQSFLAKLQVDWRDLLTPGVTLFTETVPGGKMIELSGIATGT